MSVHLEEIIDQLKLERSILKDGGYGSSVRTPRKEETLFRDSVTCLNVGEAEKVHPCNECILWEWSSPQHRNEDIPCHFIPLNERGDTIHSLESAGERDKAESAVLEWLDSTIAELEEQLVRQQASVIETKGASRHG